MNKDRKTATATTVVFLVAVVAVFTASNVINNPAKKGKHREINNVITTAQKPTPKPIPTATPTPTPKPPVTVEITYTTTEYEYIGTYYITAYCPSECGYNGNNYPTGWVTASGAICHRSTYENRLTEPTTCAIDRSLHSFGELFYIPDFDRVFVAEDTGSAVKGKHLDLFYEEFDDVYYFPTGSYAVYTVKQVEKTVIFEI